MSYPIPNIYFGGNLIGLEDGLSLGINSQFLFQSSSTTSIFSMVSSLFNRINIGRSLITGSARVDFYTGTSSLWSVGLNTSGSDDLQLGAGSSQYISINTVNGLLFPIAKTQSLLTKESHPLGIAADGQVGVASINTYDNASASYTLLLTDSSKYIRFTDGGAVGVTVPPNSTAAFAVGTEITIVNTGGGNLTITPGGGVTVNAVTNPLTVTHSQATLKKVDTDEWDFA